MSVITRIDARSKNNTGFQIRDLKGNILAHIETLGSDTVLQISTSDTVEVVKSNGVKLKRKR